MNKSERYARIAAILEQKQKEGAADLPEDIVALLKNSENSSPLKVIAITGDQLAAIRQNLSPEDVEVLNEIFEVSSSIQINVFSDLSDPRYALCNDFAKELAQRDIELTRLMSRGDSLEMVTDRSSLRLMVLNQCNIENMLNMLNSASLGRGVPHNISLAASMFSSLGFSNWLDVVRAGPDRLAWHGVDYENYAVAERLCKMSVNANIQTIQHFAGEKAAKENRDFLESLVQVKPLSPLPAEKQFIDGFDSPFLQRFAEEHQPLYDKIKSVGFNSIQDVFNFAPDSPDKLLERGITESEIKRFGKLIMQLRGDSIDTRNALDELLKKSITPVIEKMRKALDEKLPSFSIKEPLVEAALGKNLVTTMDVAGVTDIYQMIGLRNFKPAEALMEDLSPNLREEIVALTRLLNTSACDCDDCVNFQKLYFQKHPAVKAEFERYYVNPKMH